MATPERTTGLTYADLERMYPEDPRKIELIDGELFIMTGALKRHGRASLALAIALGLYAREHGGETFSENIDLYVSDTNVLQPDVMYIAPRIVDDDEEQLVRRATLVVEVSSPSTRRRDLGRKKELYAEVGVPEYWFVDLDADRIDVYRLQGGSYGPPVTSFAPGDRLTSSNLPGFELAVAEIFG